MPPVKLSHHLWGVLQVLGWFPGIMACVIPFPLYQIFHSLPPNTAVQYLLYFILRFILFLQINWFWWRWDFPIDIVTFPRVKFVDMEYGV